MTLMTLLADMSNNSLEIVHEGWLTKSPPSKPILRARWRRRWFVLRHSGELPGQYFLEYYTDRNCRKLKGKIDLDQCEQVDAGLQFESRKQKYQHMFDVRTPKRIYYLAAESEEEMNKWVECVCHVCGLKAFKDDEDEYDYGVAADDKEAGAVPETLALAGDQCDQHDPCDEADSALAGNTESPPVSPTSTISGPYIPISECISGKSLSSPNGLKDFNNIVRYGLSGTSQNRRLGGGAGGSSKVVDTCSLLPKRPVRTPYEVNTGEFYDSPRKLHPPNLDLRSGGCGSNTPPLHSPTTDAESVFTDDEWTQPVYPPPSVNWETFPNTGEVDMVKQCRPSDSSAEVELGTDIGSCSVVKSYGKYTVVDSASVGVGRTVMGRLQQQPPTVIAPPRPPKPSHLTETPGHSYLNLENVSPKAAPMQALKSTVPSSTSGVPSVSPGDCATSSDGTDQVPSPIPLSGDNVSDDTYDFPRSHQYTNSDSESAGGAASRLPFLSRHCYSNAAPGQVNGEVFRYDFHHDPHTHSHLLNAPEGLAGEEPTSPHSEGSSSLASSTAAAAVYSNLPSPLSVQSAGGVVDAGPGGIPTPPAVNRGLKPGRKLSDSTSIVSNEPSPGSPFPQQSGVAYPPSVDRKLKPQRKFAETTLPEQGPIKLASPPACRTGSMGNSSLRKTRAAPSPTPPISTPSTLRNGQRQRSEYNSSSDEDHRNSQDDEQIYYYQQENRFLLPTQCKRLQEIQYLDLDLESDASSCVPASNTPKLPERVTTTSTVYKTVDFIKTEAFNRTRQRVEEERKVLS